MDTMDSGSISIDGEDISAYNQRLLQNIDARKSVLSSSFIIGSEPDGA